MRGPVVTARTILALLAVIGALAFAGYQTHRADRAELALANKVTELANARTEAAQAQAKQIAEHRAKESTWRTNQAEAVHAEVLKTQAARAAAARESAAARSLSSELARVAARGRAAAADPGASADSQAAATASAVLADLLGRCSQRRSELAQYADSARIAGETCQRSYEALTP